jgi:hypothetical protein
MMSLGSRINSLERLRMRSETARHLLLCRSQPVASGPCPRVVGAAAKKGLRFFGILLRFHSWTPLKHRKRRWALAEHK